MVLSKIQALKSLLILTTAGYIKMASGKWRFLAGQPVKKYKKMRSYSHYRCMYLLSLLFIEAVGWRYF